MPAKLTQEKFLEKARAVHGDRYDYSKVVYTHSMKPVTIICKKHGEFQQPAYSHIRGDGCRKCGYEEAGEKRSNGMDEFLRRAKEKFGNKFDYSKVLMVKQADIVTITCPKHGDFVSSAYNFIVSEHGCQECAKDAIGAWSTKLKTKTQEEAIADFVKVHGDEYDYTKTIYKGSSNFVTITCKKHGDFTILATSHLSGYGCRKCKRSKNVSNGEDSLAEFLEGYATVVRNTRKFVKPYEVDILLPNNRLAVEYCGHYWHSDRFKRFHDAYKHRNKLLACRRVGVNLITLFENEWLERRPSVENFLTNKIFRSPIPLNRVEVNTIEGIALINEYGLLPATNNQTLVGIHHPATVEALEFMVTGTTVNIIQYVPRFKASKENLEMMLDKLVETTKARTIEVIIDLRWFTGNLWRKCGFSLIEEIPPSAYYVKSMKRLDPRSIDPLTFDGYSLSQTLGENMKRLRWAKVYDCGKLRLRKSV